ncbi:MAG: MBL fold metallo-hydrolase [bacterium]
MFGNAPKPLWSRWMESDSMNRIPLACRSLYIETSQSKRILLEAGIGAFFEPKLQQRYGVVEANHVLLGNLQKHSIEPDSIDYIILSHMHFDHAGGLLSPWVEDEESTLLFEKAQYVTGFEQWQRANNPHPRDRASYIPHLNSLLEHSGRLALQKHKEHPDLPFIKFHYSNGHTPGMLLTELIFENENNILFCADLIPGIAWTHLPITMGYDRCAETVIDEKRDILQYCLNNHVDFFFTHDPDTPFAELGMDERKRYFGKPIERK